MKRSFTLIELMIVIAIIAIIAAIAIPNLLEARKSANEASAIASLKAISTSQVLYRDRGKDPTVTNSYGELTELGSQGLVDSVLSAGVKQGYSFDSNASTDSTRAPFVWWASASPIVIGNTGDRFFATNQSSIIFFTIAGSIVPDPTTGAMPGSGEVPIGK